MLFVLSIRVINLLQEGGALRSVRVLKATVKTVVAHAVAIAVARLLMQYGRNPGGKVVCMSLKRILSVFSPELLLSQKRRELSSRGRRSRIVCGNCSFLLRLLLRCGPRRRNRHNDCGKKCKG